MGVETKQKFWKGEEAHLGEASDDSIVHPHVTSPLKWVTVLLTDGHAWIRSPHMGKDERGCDLAGQPCQVVVVPGQGATNIKNEHFLVSMLITTELTDGVCLAFKRH